LPAMLGPVSSESLRFVADRSVSLGTNAPAACVASSTGWRPSSMRSASESRKRSHAVYADVDEALASQWLTACESQVLVHGHTHRPATHPLPSGMTRWVLSDWDADVTPVRLQVLRWQGEWQRRDLPFHGHNTQ